MNSNPRSLAVADDPIVQEAAEDFLLAGGSALGAVAYAFFAAAGAYAGVLLSPVTVLVAGVGLGSRAFDGRPRQPGLGTKRPRGFKEDEPVPEAAGIAVPAGVAAVLVALAYDEALRLARLTKAGIRRANDSGAESRAALLERIRSVGAKALQEPAFVRPLLHVAGPAQGGLLTSSDFTKLTELDRPAVEQSAGQTRVCVAPWAVEEFEGQPPGRGHAICAVDPSGQMAAMSYRRVVDDGLLIDELELEAPIMAIPVRRGVPRLSPGTPLPAPAPCAIVLNENGVPIQARLWPAAKGPDLSPNAQPTLGIKWDPVTQRAESLR